MKTSRRNFLKMSAFALTGATIVPGLSSISIGRSEIIGLQLYSVRDDMQKDPVGTLKKLADMGYRYVEHANYINRKFYGYNAIDFKKLLDDFGLKMPSGHVSFSGSDWNTAKKDFTDKWKFTIEDATTAGQKFLINPWMNEGPRKDYAKLIQLLDLFNKAGELCKQFDLKFGYHNHDFEFKTMLKGHKLYDIILNETDPELVCQEMDIGNMYNGGGKPLEILKAHPGRFELMHVKDEIRSKQGEMGDKYGSTVLGKGILPVESIIDLAKKIGKTHYFIIEQESYQDMSPLESSREDYAAMRNWGY